LKEPWGGKRAGRGDWKRLEERGAQRGEKGQMKGVGGISEKGQKKLGKGVNVEGL